MGFLSPASATPPPPPPVPPAANPPTYASSAVQAAGAGARRKAAVGAGFDGSLFTGPQGAGPGPSAAPSLAGNPIGNVFAMGANAALKDKLGA